jgi:hypothetical protein
MGTKTALMQHPDPRQVDEYTHGDSSRAAVKKEPQRTLKEDHVGSTMKIYSANSTHKTDSTSIVDQERVFTIVMVDGAV